MGKIKEHEIISMGASLLLAIFLTALSFLFVAKVGFATMNSITGIINKTNFYEESYEELMSNCESLAIPYGLKSDVFVNAFTKENVKWDGKSYLKATLEGKSFKSELDNYEYILKADVKKYVVDNNLSVNGDEDEIINEFSAKARLEYGKAVQIPYISTFAILYKMINRFFIPGIIIMSIFSAIAIWIIIKQNQHKKNRIFKYIAYSTTSTCISILIIPLFLQISGIYKRVQIYPEYFYNFLQEYVKHGINVMFGIGAFFLVISAILIGTSTYVKHYYIHHHRSHHHEHHSEEAEV